MVIDTDCTGSCKSVYHAITTRTAHTNKILNIIPDKLHNTDIRLKSNKTINGGYLHKDIKATY